MEKQQLLNLSTDDLKNILTSSGFKPFAAKQIFRWIYKDFVTDFDKMTNLSIKLREYLKEKFNTLPGNIINQQTSKDGTIKYAIRLYDSSIIEGVLIFDKKRTTLCVSTQVGCPLKCAFCVTGSGGFKRNLNTNEIIGQILHACILGFKPTNIVFMGMGEPLLNIENLKKSLKLMFDPAAFAYSQRKVTISTSGIADKMLELDKEIPFLSWAISLHAPDDDLRNSFMPVNKKYNLETLVKTMKQINLKPRQKWTIEYILIKKLNSGKENALKLIKLLKGIKYKVNLITYNSNPYTDFKSPSQKETEEFQQELTDHNIVCKIRKSKGDDISAACGQLAMKETQD